MKKHLIIGNPISHSLSPKIHNFWFKENKIDGNYEKIEIKEKEINNILQEIKNENIYGMNITVPFKQSVIPYLGSLSEIAKETNSVNTIFKKNGKIHGDNTDVYGFEKSIVENKIDLKNKTALILGAGGVVPSIIIGLRRLKIKKIYITNRTLENAEKLKKKFVDIDIVEWGKIENCDIFINSTSIGLNKNENIILDLHLLNGVKLFYDLIYNPPKTRFLSEAEKKGHKIFNGRDMFLYQAQEAFNLWHNIKPKINERLIDYLYND